MARDDSTTIIHKVRPKAFPMAQPRSGLGKWTPPPLPVPPIPPFVWIRGLTRDLNTLRTDFMPNQFHFTHVSDDVRTGPFAGTMSAPGPGMPGYVELQANDPTGFLYAAGVPIVGNRVHWQNAHRYAISTPNMFFCDRYDTGLLIYEVGFLSPADYALIADWCYCPVTHRYTKRDRIDLTKVQHPANPTPGPQPEDIQHEWRI